MGARDRNLEEFSAEVRHGAVEVSATNKSDIKAQSLLARDSGFQWVSIQWAISKTRSIHNPFQVPWQLGSYMGFQ